MYLVTHKNGMEEILRSRREVDFAFPMSTKQWHQIESGQEIQVDTFMGPVNFRKMRRGEIQ